MLVHHGHNYQSSAVKAWYKPMLFSHILDWFDLAHNNKYDHRSSVRTLGIILNNKTLYMFVPPHDLDCMTHLYMQVWLAIAEILSVPI